MLINFHIPKTAGTAIATLLQTSHGVRHVQLYYPPPFAFLPASEYLKLRSYYGHALSLSSHNLPRVDVADFWPEAKFMAVLRDPVERVCSAYFHLLRFPPHQRYGGVTPSSLEDFVCHQEEEKNVMVRFLCALPLGETVASPQLDQAAQECGKYDLLGLTDDIPETLRRLKAQVPTVAGDLSWENTNPARRADAKYRASLPAATIRLIEQHNALDVALYDYACTLFYQ